MDIDSPDLIGLATSIESYYYAREHMKGKPRFAGRQDLLVHSMNNITLDGLVLEFGVGAGHTINLIAGKLSDHVIYGFDSFKGLPERWSHAGPGSFAQDSLPSVRENVELVVGMFDRTLPTFLDSHDGNVSFLHVDCDLYTSTQTVLQQLTRRVVAGTIIVFDEYFNYDEWKQHEFLAFQQFIKYNKIRYEYIGLVPRYEHVAVRVL
jgi:hypothetical protein